MSYWYDPDTGAERWPADVKCNGLCLIGADVAYPHPSCPAHGVVDVQIPDELNLEAHETDLAKLTFAYVLGYAAEPV